MLDNPGKLIYEMNVNGRRLHPSFLRGVELRMKAGFVRAMAAFAEFNPTISKHDRRKLLGTCIVEIMRKTFF